MAGKGKKKKEPRRKRRLVGPPDRARRYSVGLRLFCAILPTFYLTFTALGTSLTLRVSESDHEIILPWHSPLKRSRLPSVYRNDTASSEEYHLSHVVSEQAKPGLPLWTSTYRKNSNQNDTSENRNDKSVKDCFEFNSKAWLEGPRLGNAATLAGIDNRFAAAMILGSIAPLNKASNLLKQSFCHEKSRFLDVTSTPTYKETDEDSSNFLRLWTVRLIYLIVHRHQHDPAAMEAQHQQVSQKCIQERSHSHNLGPMDYECPTAKFLVVRLYHNGLGANLRIAAVPAFMAGLASNRVVLFVNNAPESAPRFLQTPWTLASCPRKDMQCMFLPTSPCTLLETELAEGYVLPRGEMRRLFRMGILPVEHQEDRVVVLNLPFRPQRVPENLPSVLYNHSMSLIEELLAENDTPANSEQHRDILKKAATNILQDTSESDEYSYYGAKSSIYHSLLLYALRPNPETAMRVNEMVHDALPSDLEPSTIMGLPIRGMFTGRTHVFCLEFVDCQGFLLTTYCVPFRIYPASDKCGTESECMSFSNHLDAAQESWKHYLGADSSPTHLIVTTESRSIQEAVPDEPRFILNHHDVTQDTGYLDEPVVNTTADRVMLSALSSLKLQLQSRVTLGNCCSNFHLLLKDLLWEGCGAFPTHNFQCLQDHADPRFRLCCSWDKSDECLARRKDGHIQSVLLL